MAWFATLDLKDIWPQSLEEAEKYFASTRDTIVYRIKASEFWDLSDRHLTGIVDDLAESQSLDDFNFYWNDFYDYADANRIWVATF